MGAKPTLRYALWAAVAVAQNLNVATTSATNIWVVPRVDERGPFWAVLVLDAEYSPVGTDCWSLYHMVGIEP